MYAFVALAIVAVSARNFHRVPNFDARPFSPDSSLHLPPSLYISLFLFFEELSGSGSNEWFSERESRQVRRIRAAARRCQRMRMYYANDEMKGQSSRPREPERRARVIVSRARARLTRRPGRRTTRRRLRATIRTAHERA